MRSANHRCAQPIQPVMRPERYKEWTAESLHHAIEAVGREVSIRSAAVMYGVPRSTLGEHAGGRRLPGGRSGDPYLNLEEEEELVSFLV